MFIISHFKDMTLHLRQVGSENEVNPRKMQSGVDSLIVQGIFGNQVTNIDAKISQATVDIASEILWTLSKEYKRVALELDVFQVPYQVQIPQKKLFMAGELVVTQQDTQKVGDIVMYNGMRTIQDQSGKVIGYVPSQTHINLELPLIEYRGVTKEVLGKIWSKIDKLLLTNIPGQPMIMHISRGRDGNESRKSIGYTALKDADISGLKEKQLHDPMLDIDREVLGTF